MAKTFTGSWIIFIILLIICWPAAIVYLLIKYEEPRVPGPYSSGGGAYGVHGGGRVCGACGQSYDYTLSSCPYCGRPSYYSNTAPPYQHDVRFCPNCGSSNQQNAQFCSKCGNRL